MCAHVVANIVCAQHPQAALGAEAGLLSSALSTSPALLSLPAAACHWLSWHGGIAAAMLQFSGQGCWRIVQSSGFIDLSLVDQQGLLS